MDSNPLTKEKQPPSPDLLLDAIFWIVLILGSAAIGNAWSQIP